jgi:hypothetical protein
MGLSEGFLGAFGVKKKEDTGETKPGEKAKPDEYGHKKMFDDSGSLMKVGAVPQASQITSAPPAQMSFGDNSSRYEALKRLSR